MVSNHRGSTLIELLFSISILLIVLTSFYALTEFLHRDYVNQSALAESLQESRIATTFFQDEVRNAEKVIEASETSFHLMWDENNDGDFDDPNEKIRYQWFGKRSKSQSSYTLTRKTGNDGKQQEVALGIRSFQLEYFDENGRQLPSGLLGQANQSKIRKMILTLKGSRTWTSEIYLKNIG